MLQLFQQVLSLPDPDIVRIAVLFLLPISAIMHLPADVLSCSCTLPIVECEYLNIAASARVRAVGEDQVFIKAPRESTPSPAADLVAGPDWTFPSKRPPVSQQ